MSRLKKTSHQLIYYYIKADGSKSYYVRIKKPRDTFIHCGPRISNAIRIRDKYRVARAEDKLGLFTPVRAPFSEVAEEYFELFKSKSRARNWPGVKSVIKRLNSFFRGVEISKVTQWTIENYVRQRRADGISLRTLNTELDYLRAILNKAVEWELIARAPKVKHIPVQESRARILDATEIEYALEIASEDHRDAIFIALDTGMRLNEIYHIRREDVDFKWSTVHLGETKNLRPRSIPLTDRALEIISRRLKENKGRMFIDKTAMRLSSKFSGERKKMYELEPWRFHDLRHIWATRLLRNGVDPFTVMKLGGWSRLEMVTRYLHTDEDRKRAAIDTLDHKVDIGGGKSGIIDPEKSP